MAIYPYFSPQQDVYKPWIQIRLGNPSSHQLIQQSIIALIDSGADACLCITDIAKALKIKLDHTKTREFKGVNNQPIQTIKGSVQLYVCNTQLICPFYFTDKLPPSTPIILGHECFFNRFRITFDFKNKQMELLDNLKKVN
jgi:hypothetical protein